MDNIRKLPDAEFDVMVALWDCDVSPVNTAYLMENVGKHKGWKAPTLISFLSRLEEKGFIHSEKRGKERQYYADAVKEDYIKLVTIDFIEKFSSTLLFLITFKTSFALITPKILSTLSS